MSWRHAVIYTWPGRRCLPFTWAQKQHYVHPRVSQCHTKSLMKKAPSVFACSHSLQSLNSKFLWLAKGTSLRLYHVSQFLLLSGTWASCLFPFITNKTKQTLWQSCPTSSTDKPGPVWIPAMSHCRKGTDLSVGKVYFFKKAKEKQTNEKTSQILEWLSRFLGQSIGIEQWH